MVQCLGLCASISGGMGSIPSQGTKIPQAMQCGQKKKDTVYIYTMEYDSAITKNEIMPSAGTWVDLESILLSEVRQRKTNII